MNQWIWPMNQGIDSNYKVIRCWPIQCWMPWLKHNVGSKLWALWAKRCLWSGEGVAEMATENGRHEQRQCTAFCWIDVGEDRKMEWDRVSGIFNYIYIWCLFLFVALMAIHSLPFPLCGGPHVLDISTATHLKIMKPFLVSFKPINKKGDQKSSAP